MPRCCALGAIDCGRLSSRRSLVLYRIAVLHYGAAESLIPFRLDLVDWRYAPCVECQKSTISFGVLWSRCKARQKRRLLQPSADGAPRPDGGFRTALATGCRRLIFGRRVIVARSSPNKGMLCALAGTGRVLGPRICHLPRKILGQGGMSCRSDYSG